MNSRIIVGTASWADPEFVRDWYPSDVRASDRLRWYADHFEMVEVNSSFYAIPSRALVARWCRETPPDFTFDVKLFRLLSRHATKPENLPEDLRSGAALTRNGTVQVTPDLEAAVTRRFVEQLAPMEDAGKLKALLLQLTPSFSPKAHQLDELNTLIEMLQPRQVAVELRNRDWVEPARLDETLAWFRERRATFVCVDAPRAEHFMIMPGVDSVTQPTLAYLRLHGRNAHGYISGKTVAERFDYKYSREELNQVAHRAQNLARDADEVHLVFNNNRSNYAPINAQEFRRILGQPPARGESQPGLFAS